MNPLESQPNSSRAVGARRLDRRTVVLSLLLATITLAVFWPVRGYDFVNFDDPVYVTENARVLNGLGWENLRWAFTNLEAGFWQPLVWLSYMLDVSLLGKQAGGLHFTNLLLHLGSTVLLFLLLRRLTGALWRSAVVAGLFALHPLHVEPVAWISSRKDVLSTFFGLLSLIFYARYVEALNRKTVEPLNRWAGLTIQRFNGSTINYALSFLFFACGLMSKTMLVSWPIVMLLLDWWPLGRFNNPTVQRFNLRLAVFWRLVREKLPFLVAALVTGLITMYAEHGIGALSPVATLPIEARLANAALSYVQYLWQTVWPVGLAVFYPYPRGMSIEWSAGSALLLIAISFLTLWQARRRAYLAVGWGWYVITLMPVIGLFQVGAHARADRYMYVPLIGLAIIATWGAAELLGRLRAPRMLAGALAVLVLAACGLRARGQLRAWQNSETLFSHVIEATRDNYLAYNNRGVYLAAKGRTDEAVALYRKALEIRPDFVPALVNLGNVRARQKQFDEAIALLEKAREIEPNNPKTLCSLGETLVDSGRAAEATNHFILVLTQNPKHAQAHNGLARAFTKLGELDQALRHYKIAAQLDPTDADTLNNLGLALTDTGQLADAVSAFESALRLRPDRAEIHNNLGVALRKQGRIDEAIARFHEAVRLDRTNANAWKNLGFAFESQGNFASAVRTYMAGLHWRPDDAQLHYNLANALVKSGEIDAAIDHYREAIKLGSDSADAHCNLGVALNLKGRLEEAMAEYREAIRLNPNHGIAHNNLGKALAAQGQFEQAVVYYRESVRLMPDYAVARANLGAALAKLGRREEAIAQLREALRLQPDLAEAREQLQAIDTARPD